MKLLPHTEYPIQLKVAFFFSFQNVDINSGFCPKMAIKMSRIYHRQTQKEKKITFTRPGIFWFLHAADSSHAALLFILSI